MVRSDAEKSVLRTFGPRMGPSPNIEQRLDARRERKCRVDCERMSCIKHHPFQKS